MGTLLHLLSCLLSYQHGILHTANLRLGMLSGVRGGRGGVRHGNGIEEKSQAANRIAMEAAGVADEEQGGGKHDGVAR